MSIALTDPPRQTPGGTPWGEVAGQRDIWPSATQELLLQAALMSDERALSAWRELRPHVSVDALDGATQALLPILRKNLIALGVEDELLDLFKGVHRFSWARNQTLLAAMIPVLEALERAGMPTLMLKGAAFVADNRLDAGMRPMNDVDVLVPSDRLAEAISLLGKAGLEPVGEVPGWYVVEYAPRFVPSHGFRDEQDRQLDLHWNVLHASRQPGADEDFWAAAVPIELRGFATRALCPADELLLVILHGLRWNPIPTYRWVLDAALIAQGTFGAVDYERLVAQARKRRVTVGLRAGLAYLSGVLDIPLPQRVIHELGSTRASRLERSELRIQTTRPLLRSPVQWELLYHQQYLRHRLPLGQKPSVRAHLRLMRERLGVEHWRQLPALRYGALPGPGRPSSEMAAPVGRGIGHTATRAPIALSEPLDFGLEGVGARYVAYGTWCPETGGSWIAGKQAMIVLALQQPAEGDLLLEISAEAFLQDARPSQRLEVAVGEAVVGTLTFDLKRTSRLESMVLPRGLVNGHRELQLTLCSPDAVSPAHLGLADDDRSLGVFLRHLVVRAPRECPTGSQMTLGEGSGEEGMLVGGWGEAEPTGRWTYGEGAQMLLRLEPSQAPLDLEFDAVPLLGDAHPKLRVDVAVNGQSLGSIDYDELSPCPSTTRLPLPAAVTEVGGEILIAWQVHEPRSPQQLGLSPDARPLGLFLERIAFLERP